MRRLTLLLVALFVVTSFASSADAQKKRRKKPRRRPVKAKKIDVKAELQALAGPDVDRSAKAAAALKGSTDPKATDGLLDALAMGVHPSVAAAALASLATHAKVRALDTLSYYVNYRNPKVRAAAVTALGALNDKRAVRGVLDALADGHVTVRAAAADVIARRKIRQGVESLIVLLKKGDQASASALAAIADPDLALALAELIGEAPDALLAQALGGILVRPDFKPEEARLEVVRALGKVPGNDALEQLTNYLASTPENPVRQSRREAESIIESRLSGGN